MHCLPPGGSSGGLDDRHGNLGEDLAGDVHAGDASYLGFWLEHDSVADDLQGDSLDVVGDDVVATVDCQGHGFSGRLFYNGHAASSNSSQGNAQRLAAVDSDGGSGDHDRCVTH